MHPTQFIGIEGGGTKFVCAYGTPEHIRNRTVIKTQSPHETLREIIHYIHTVQQHTTISAIGLAMFGPLDLNHASPTYGSITTSIKPGWENYNLAEKLKQEFKLPIGLNTDVNGAALGELHYGAGRDLNNLLYLTVGTGIGGGIIVDKKILHGFVHPEMGHILIPQNHSHAAFKGVCRYHQHCLEGLASGPALLARWNVNSIFDLPLDHPAWDLEAHYLALGIVNYILTFAPQRIIVGGGVLQQVELLAKIRVEVMRLLNDYVRIQCIDEYIVQPALGENSGVCGALVLAAESLQRSVQLKMMESVSA